MLARGEGGKSRGLKVDLKEPSNNGMHPTADTLLVKFSEGAARRVMPSVRAPERSGLIAREASARFSGAV